MRKRGDILDRVLRKMGHSEAELEKLQFVKIAMIDRVLFNLDNHHRRKTGSALFTDVEYDEVVKEAASEIAIADILALEDVKSKVGFIMKTIGRILQ